MTAKTLGACRPAAAVLLVFLACAGGAKADPTWLASTSPAGGNIAGPAGSRIGWGYTVDNPDPSFWLVLTGFSADALQNAVGEVLFDFPVLSPGTSNQVPYDGVAGLYALTWAPTAPTGFVNFGSFVLDAEWWNGDPLSGGQFVSAATSMTLNFSATVSQVPEPSAAVLAVLGLAGLGWRLRRTMAR